EERTRARRGEAFEDGENLRGAVAEVGEVGGDPREVVPEADGRVVVAEPGDFELVGDAEGEEALHERLPQPLRVRPAPTFERGSIDTVQQPACPIPGRSAVACIRTLGWVAPGADALDAGGDEAQIRNCFEELFTHPP